MSSYVLLWNPKEWAHANILRMIRDLQKSGIAKEPWRFMSNKSGKAGDKVFLLKTGTPPRGIFGHGRLAGRPFDGLGSDGKQHKMFEAHFDQLVDPFIEFLVPEVTLNQIPNWSVQRGSGHAPLDEAVAESLLSHLGHRGIILQRLLKRSLRNAPNRYRTQSENN